MSFSPALLSLCLLAFSLGAKHGLDADHLATIDGVSRANLAERPRLARWTGALFSLGHGAVVAAAALAASALAGRWEAPAWLEISGSAVSIVFLIGLALLNFRALARTPKGQVVRITGWRGRMLGGRFAIGHPLAVAGVGALFALSFDTISQAGLFAVTASAHGGVPATLCLAGAFVAGMLAIDGLNGLTVARLIGRADARAAAASRVMTLTVGSLSLAVGVLTLAKLGWPALDSWSDDNALWLGLAVVAAVLLAFATAMRLAAPVRRA